MITSASVELDDIGSALSWGAFLSFIRHLPVESATYQELHPEVKEWSGSFKTNLILADIYDVLSQINANLCGGFSRRRPQRVKPYPRPWIKERVIGKGALPASELEEWIEKARRRENG